MKKNSPDTNTPFLQLTFLKKGASEKLYVC